jgi:hypothetical protein
MGIGHCSKRKRSSRTTLCWTSRYFYRFPRRIALWVVGARSVSLSPGFLPRGNEKESAGTTSFHMLAEYFRSSVAHRHSVGVKCLRCILGLELVDLSNQRKWETRSTGPFDTHKLGCPSIFHFAIIFKVSLKANLGTWIVFLESYYYGRKRNHG